MCDLVDFILLVLGDLEMQLRWRVEELHSAWTGHHHTALLRAIPHHDPIDLAMGKFNRCVAYHSWELAIEG